MPTVQKAECGTPKHQDRHGRGCRHDTFAFARSNPQERWCAAVRANAQKDMVVGMILILIFAEALGLFGFIVAIVVNLGG